MNVPNDPYRHGQAVVHAEGECGLCDRLRTPPEEHDEWCWVACPHQRRP